MLGRHVRRAIDIDNGVLGIEDEQTDSRQSGLDAEIGGRAVDLHFLVAKDLADHVIADVQTRQLHQFATDGAIVDQHLQVAIGAAQQFGHRVATPGDVSIAIELAEAGFHGFKGRKQLLELEPACGEFRPALQRIGTTVQANLRIEIPASDAKAQRLKAEHAVGQHQVCVEIVERQFFAVHDALAGEFHIGVHVAPAIGFELFDRQHFIGRLLAVAASGLLLGIGIGTDQGGEVGKQHLIGQQRAAELRPRLAGNVGQIAVNIAVADLAVEVVIAIHRAAGFMQLANQVTVGGVGRRVRQGDAGQRIEIAQAGTGEFQAQIQRAKVHRIGQGAGQLNARVRHLHLRLKRKRSGGILQGQQSADLALPREFLAVILAVDLEGERIVLRDRALRLRGLRRFDTDDVAEGNRFTQRIDKHIEPGLEVLIVEGDMALVETDRADVYHPIRRFGARVLGVELEGPVGAPISQALQAGVRFGEVDARNHHSLRQQRQRRNAQFDALEGDHLRRLGPVRVAQAQVLRHHMRPRYPRAPAPFIGLTLPDHRQIAVDGKRPVQFFRDFGIEGRFDPVPVKKHDDQHQHRQQDNEAGEGPGENFTSARHCTELLIRPSARTATPGETVSRNRPPWNLRLKKTRQV
ncbi:hypothetical protein D3C84_490320 [compost metagenome]